MVRVFPFKSLLPKNYNDADSPPNPNRFNSTNYDRSAPYNRYCTKSKSCSCMICDETPVVVVSPDRTFCRNYSVQLQNADELLEGNILEFIDKSSFLIYSQNVGGHVQTGICVALSVDDCFDGVLKRHENTIKACEPILHTPDVADKSRTSNVDPVMIMYRDNQVIDEIVKRIINNSEPLITSKLSSSSIHKIWKVSCSRDIDIIQSAFQTVEDLYIADGHHRTAAACRLAQQMDSKKPSYIQSRYLMGLLYPQSHLKVLPFGRCLKSLEGLSPEEFINKVEIHFDSQVREDLIRLNRDTGSTYPCTTLSDQSTPPEVSRNDKVYEVSSPPSPSSSSSKVHHHSRIFCCSPRSSPLFFSSTLDYIIHSGHRSDKKNKETASSPSSSGLHIQTIDTVNSLGLLSISCNNDSDDMDNHHMFEPRHPHNILMYISHRWYELTPKELIEEKCLETGTRNPLNALGVQILLDHLLNPILGAEDPNDCRMIYVGGADCNGRYLEKLVDSEKVGVAFCVAKIDIEDVMKVADAGQLLPPKATCFEPKPLPGLLMRLH